MARTPNRFNSTPVPSFTNSAIASAIAAFSNAGEGVSRTAEQIDAFTDKRNKKLTNQAISDALEGRGVSNDPNVDQVALRQLLRQEETQDEAILASTGQRGLTAAELIGQTNENENFDQDVAQLTELRRQQGVNFDRQGDAAGARQDLSEFQLKVGKDDFEDKETQETQVAQIEAFRDDFKQNYIDDRLVAEALNGRQPTKADRERILVEAEAEATGTAGQAAVERFVTDNNILHTSRQASSFGDIQARAQAVQDVQLGKLQDQADQKQADADRYRLDTEAGGFEFAVTTGLGLARPATDEDITSQKVSANIDDILNKMGSFGPRINLSHFRNKKNDKSIAALKSAANKFPLASTLASVVQSFMRDGELDHGKLQSAVDASGHLARMTIINEARRSNGLDELDFAGNIKIDEKTDPLAPPRTTQQVIKDGAALTIAMGDAANIVGDITKEQRSANPDLVKELEDSLARIEGRKRTFSFTPGKITSGAAGVRTQRAKPELRKLNTAETAVEMDNFNRLYKQFIAASTTQDLDTQAQAILEAARKK